MSCCHQWQRGRLLLKIVIDANQLDDYWWQQQSCVAFLMVALAVVTVWCGGAQMMEVEFVWWWCSLEMPWWCLVLWWCAWRWPCLDHLMEMTCIDGDGCLMSFTWWCLALVRWWRWHDTFMCLMGCWWAYEPCDEVSYTLPLTYPCASLTYSCNPLQDPHTPILNPNIPSNTLPCILHYPFTLPIT